MIFDLLYVSKHLLIRLFQNQIYVSGVTTNVFKRQPLLQELTKATSERKLVSASIF